MSQVDQVTQRNASAAEELASTAEQMASQAVSLQQLISFFRLRNIEERRHHHQDSAALRMLQTAAPLSPTARRSAVANPVVMGNDSGATAENEEDADDAGQDGGEFKKEGAGDAHARDREGWRY
jgi:hypothetical protein